VRVEEIINNTTCLQRNRWVLKVFTKLFSDSETWGASQFGRQIKISASCKKCLKCTRICPEQNINFSKGTLQFGEQCVFCMRCFYSCPEGSIIPGFSRFIKIKNWDSFENIGKNESVPPDFVTSKTKGYFKHYQKYFEDI
jgi:Fe-S-cluster-containing hydrogenase component 2